eukprot:c14327_g2_i1 orf=151-345(-)
MLSGLFFTVFQSLFGLESQCMILAYARVCEHPHRDTRAHTQAPACAHTPSSLFFLKLIKKVAYS